MGSSRASLDSVTDEISEPSHVHSFAGLQGNVITTMHYCRFLKIYFHVYSIKPFYNRQFILLREIVTKLSQYLYSNGALD